MKPEYILNLIAGILILISALFINAVLGIISMWAPLFDAFIYWLIIAGALIPGVLIIRSSIKIKQDKDVKKNLIIALVCNIFALALTLGFVIGPILGIIGSVIGLRKL